MSYRIARLTENRYAKRHKRCVGIMGKSIEEKIEDIAKQQLNDFKVKYFTKTESINTEIDEALKNAPSKNGGIGANFPDIKCFVEQKGRKLPVMIEVKGRKEDIEKLNDLGEVDNYDKKDLPIYANIAKYAVNGAVHYATAIVNFTESYKEAIAIGFTGWESGKNIKTAMRVYYVSDENYNVPKLVEGYEDFSFLTGKELDDFVEKIDALYLTEDEKEKLTQKLETQIESNLKKLNQEMRDAYSISEDYRVKLISGMIIAGLGVEQNGKTIVAPLEIDDLRSKEEKKSHDGVTIMNTIESFLETKNIPSEKIALIKTNFEQVFIQTDLYKQYKEGESRLKKVYITVKKDIVPFFIKKKYHLDFTGKLFNVLNDWVKVPDGDQNDVVLTPRYVCDLMVKLCRVNKDSFVWDYAAGSGGFLVAAMKQMVSEANRIEDKTERDAKINSIKMKQLLGVELRPDMYALAVLNMILMGDGSTHILCDDSLTNYSGNYEQGPEKDEIFPANVFLLNPPYSEEGKGFNFVELALNRMNGGYADVLIQENAGSGNGEPFTRRILENNTLVASIKMGDIFCGKSSVQTAIYVFDVGHVHPEKKRVKFIDFTNDGYARQSRKKSSQEVNLRDIGDVTARYKEIVDIVLDCEPDTEYYTKENGLYVTDTITTQAALEEPKKRLDKIKERLDPLRKELLAKQMKLKENEKALKENEKRLAKAEKDEDKMTLARDAEKTKKLNDKIQKEITVITSKKEPIESELAIAQKVYDDIFNRIGADWTYGQHRKIDTVPTEADFRKTVSDYLSWRITSFIKSGKGLQPIIDKGFFNDLSQYEIEAIKKLQNENVKWRDIPIGDLFDIHPTNAYKLTNSHIFHIGGKNPVVTNSSVNNGVTGYSDLEPTENGNMITYSDTTTSDGIFYQPNDFVGYPHVQGLYPKKYLEKWNEKTLLYFVSLFRKSAGGRFDYANKFNRAIASKMIVKLPVTSNGEIDWNFMQNLISAESRLALRGVVEWK